MKSRRKNKEVNAWPGFVDALSSLIMVMLFMLIIFILAQFFMGQDIKGQDKELNLLNNKIRSLSQDLSFKETENSSLKEQLILARSEYDKKIEDANTNIAKYQSSLNSCKLASTNKACPDSEALYVQLEEIRKEFTALSIAMDASDKYNEEQKAQIIAIGKRLNRALATKVSELQKYRSEFLENIGKIIDSHDELKAKGDHFAFQSELLFKSGSSEISEEGKNKLVSLANQVKAISDKIPPSVNWILRVDGHTDKLPINNSSYSSNWELSTARAVNVVEFLISQGVSPYHLTATGFGEFSPIYDGEDPDKLKLNRRIEFSLTSK